MGSGVLEMALVDPDMINQKGGTKAMKTLPRWIGSKEEEYEAEPAVQQSTKYFSQGDSWPNL